MLHLDNIHVPPGSWWAEPGSLKAAVEFGYQAAKILP
jgi:hypothetical protein